MQVSGNKQNLSPSKVAVPQPEPKELAPRVGPKDCFVRSAAEAPAAPAAEPEAAEKPPSRLSAERGLRDTVAAVYTPPLVVQSPFKGSAPALAAEAMDEAVIQQDMSLRVIYGLKDRFPIVLRVYSAVTRVAGPLGAIAWFGLNIHNSIKFLRDPKAPVILKGGIVGATVLSGAAAATATRMSLAAFNVWPATNQALQLLGRATGVFAGGAGTLLAVMDTYNTFRNPRSTPAEKGFSVIGTAAAAAGIVTLLAGVTGPLGIVLGALAAAGPLAKNFLGKKPLANQIFGQIGWLAGGTKEASAERSFRPGLAVRD